MGSVGSVHELAGGGDSGWGSWRESKVEAFHEKALIWIRLGVTAQDQGAAIIGREMDIEHLDAGELIEHRARGETRRQRFELRSQGDVQAVGHEVDKDVGFDAMLELMVDRAQLQIVLEVFERRLDFRELDIEPPEILWVSPTQIGAQ